MLANPADLSPALLAAITALNEPIADLNNLLQPTINAVKALATE